MKKLLPALATTAMRNTALQLINLKNKVVTLFVAFFLLSVSVFGHSVTGYTPGCNAGPNYSILPIVTNVNSTSNYGWQYKDASNVWVCIVNGNNTINGFTYSVSGASSTLTVTPSPLVFNNPNSGLQGLVVRCVISDGAGVNPCTMPSGNTYNSDANSVNLTISVSGTSCGNTIPTCVLGGININNLTQNLFVFTNGNVDANWQGATKGFIGSVLVNGVLATERTSGTVPYAGTIYSNDATLSAWQNIVNANSGQAYASLNQTSMLTSAQTELENAFTQINALTVTPGYASSISTSLNGLNTQNGIPQTIVINVTSGFTISSQINITGDASDVFIFRWDTDANFSNGYNGQVKFESGGAIVPLGGLTAGNFIHVAGDINSSGGGSNPSIPFPQGPRTNNGTGSLISGGSDFGGGGFFTGYWLTTGAPTITGSGQPYGATSSLSNGIFVGGWYTKTTQFSMTSGTSGVYVSPAVCLTSGSIGDRVWLDANGNGIQDASETGGITGVTVQLYNSAGTTLLATTTTNGSGNYLFSGLVAGSYKVMFPVSLSGSVVTTQHVGTNTNIDSDPSQATGFTDVITLTTGQNRTDIDAGYCPVNLQLGNRVWYDTNNNGINDAAENGIRNITVYLYKDDNNDNVADGAALATALTDVNGNYLFSNLVPGNYIVGAVTPNGYMSSVINGGDPDNNIDLDDNGQVAIGTEMRGLAITLTGGGEPSGNTNNTYDFGFLPDCSCTSSVGNLLVNGSFENGTTGWSWNAANGNLTTGTGFIACGLANGFNNWTSGSASKVWQDVNMAAGVVVKLSAFAGTHTAGISCSPTLSLIFLNASNGVISQSDVVVTQDVDLNFSQLANYTISAVSPAGTVKVRVQSSITCNTMKIDAFCLTSDNTACVTCALGYPDNSNLPKSAVVFNENEVLRAMEPSSTTCGILNSGFIKLWYSDEHALFLGVDSVVVKRANGSVYSTKYPITTYGGTPTCGSNLLFGTTINTGAQSGNDVADGGGRPIRPVLYLTDLTINGNTSRVGDWQQGGTPYNPTTVCGNWKSGYKFVDSTKNPVLVQINPYSDPATNISGTTWNLGGGEQPPAGTTNQSYGSLVKWDISLLGLIPGHSYRIQVMVHDGDQNKSGGDAGSMCTTIFFPAQASIGDRVWKDDNKNGIQDAGEVGIAGVTIVLLNSAGQVLATTTTDAFGLYKFSNLAAGTYSVRINPPANYAISPKTQGADTNVDSDFDLVSSTTGSITLASGQNRTDIDCGLNFSQNIKASVGDRVWLDTNADGVQDAGEPGVSNVLVTLYNSTGTAIRYTYTDVNGLYLFTDVAVGTYTVGVSLPPAFVFSPNNGVISGATNSDIIPASGRTASFTVNAGDQITYVDAGIKLQVSTNGSIGDYVWNDINKNGIQEADEPAIAGVTIRLLHGITNAVIATTTTDITGKYIFNDVPAGNYKVEFVTPAGYTTTTKLSIDPQNSNTDSDVDPVTSRSAAFPLGAGQRITTIDAGYWLTGPPGTAKLGDYVWLDANQNGIQDAGEPAVAGITVVLYNVANVAIKQSVTGAGGKYLFTDLAAGTYSVGFSNVPAGFTFTTQGAGTAATGSDANQSTGKTSPITLIAGQINLDVDAGIRSSLAGSGSLGNKVWYDLNNNGLQDAGELGIQGVTVALLDASGNPVDKDPVTPGVQPTITITNALGEYLFTGLDAGDYKVRFSTLPTGYNPVTKNAGTDRNIDSDGNPVSAGSSTTDLISLAANEERLDIDLGLFNPTAPLGQIGDFVWFDSNNNGLQDAGEQGAPGVSVTLFNTSGTIVATTVTDGNGNYKFVNLSDATYSVKFSNLPAGFVFSPKDVGANDNVDSDVDPSGLTGTYTISGGNTNLTVDAGIYSTRAALGDYVWFDVNNNGTQDAGEKGIVGVTVTIYDAANNAVTSTITDQNGRYFFSNLNPGTYTVGFETTPTKMVFTTKDVVAAGDAADSDVDPATGKTGSYTLVAGQVNLTVDAGLRPFIPATIGDYVWFDLNRDGLQDAVEPGVPGVIVTLYNSANQPIGSAVTDGNGYYLISNVPPGTGYYVKFSNQPDITAPWTVANVGGAAANNNSKADATGKTIAFSVAEGQNITNLDAGLTRIINIYGHVWNDDNGLTDLEINKTGTAAIPNSLNVYLVDFNTNLILQVEGINPDGTYSFLNVDVNHSYKIVISSTVAFPGQTSPTVLLPSGWQRVGENLGAGPLSGSDGVPNGLLFLDTETGDVKEANFGIRLGSGEVIIG